MTENKVNFIKPVVPAIESVTITISLEDAVLIRLLSCVTTGTPDDNVLNGYGTLSSSYDAINRALGKAGHGFTGSINGEYNISYISDLTEKKFHRAVKGVQEKLKA